MIKVKHFLCLFLSVFLFTFPLITSLSISASADCNSEYEEVDLGYLSTHLEDFCGKNVRTAGIVNGLISFYMYEDFWLSKLVPVVIRFSELSKPPENSSIEVCGIIKYCNLEGGFFYLNAHSWTYAEETMPEFQSVIIVPLFMIAALLAVIIHKRKRAK